MSIEEIKRNDNYIAITVKLREQEKEKERIRKNIERNKEGYIWQDSYGRFNRVRRENGRTIIENEKGESITYG